MEFGNSIGFFFIGLFGCLFGSLALGIVITLITLARKNKELAFANIFTGIIAGSLCAGVYLVTSQSNFTTGLVLFAGLFFFIGFSVGLGFAGLFSIISLISEKHQSVKEY